MPIEIEVTTPNGLTKVSLMPDKPQYMCFPIANMETVRENDKVVEFTEGFTLPGKYEPVVKGTVSNKDGKVLFTVRDKLIVKEYSEREIPPGVIFNIQYEKTDDANKNKVPKDYYPAQLVPTLRLEESSAAKPPYWFDLSNYKPSPGLYL